MEVIHSSSLLWHNIIIAQLHLANNYTACADFPNVIVQRHICGGEHPGGYDPQILSRPRFLCSVANLQVSSSYVYSLGSYPVDKQQTPLKTPSAVRYATTLAKYSYTCVIISPPDGGQKALCFAAVNLFFFFFLITSQHLVYELVEWKPSKRASHVYI